MTRNIELPGNDSDGPLTRRERFAMAALPQAQAGMREGAPELLKKYAEKMEEAGGGVNRMEAVVEELKSEFATLIAAGAVEQADALIAALDGDAPPRKKEAD